jgi:hypothetical protein
MEIDEGRRAEYVRGEAPSACRFCANAGVITVIGRLQDSFDTLPTSDEFRNAESISAPAFILPACEISDFSESENDAIFASHDNHHRKLRSAGNPSETKSENSCANGLGEIINTC